ncbi:MAG: DUF1800 family protein [Anaerolineae bacterium]|jgi:uncharacterized protein (DUF1800 family)|nr:DUF1800 family protein [Anaerolineae bacterium]MBT7070823.1 DUF1800 family protein [Anaerolineae bacterium]MBT7323705.1 DUF1800 family protein [Anaerolineae bacterium]
MSSKLSRRDFFKASGILAAGMALAACQPSLAEAEPAYPTLAPDPGSASPPLTDEALLLHTLKRISFGVTPAMLARARSIGLDAYIEEQLFPENHDNSEVENLLSNLKTLTMTAKERLDLEKDAQSIQELIGATLLQQWKSPSQLYEVMVDFWTNHFNIYIVKNQCRVLKTDDDQAVIRPYALGKFGELLSASAHSPAMLVYLDQATSTRRAPNENYARELLELHTVGVDGGYSHEDVVELARTLTGWSVTGFRDRNQEPGQFSFRRQAHDDGQKQVLGTVVPAGGGIEDGEIILDMLAQHPMTARFISTKLARRFVADDPPASLIEKLSQVFLSTAGDTREMLRTLLHSDEFKASAGQKMKRPLEFFISALRVTDAKIQRTPRALTTYLRQMGQMPFFWSPPTGYPDYAAWWATTSGMLNRWNFALLLTAGEVPGVAINLSTLTADAASAQDLVDLLSIRFLSKKLPSDARDILIDFASTGSLDKNLPDIAGLILGSPHFQVR